MICNNVSRVRITKASASELLNHAWDLIYWVRTTEHGLPELCESTVMPHRCTSIGRGRPDTINFKNGTISAGDTRNAIHNKPLSLHKQWEMMIVPIWPRRGNYRSVTLINFCRTACSSLIFRRECTFYAVNNIRLILTFLYVLLFAHRKYSKFIFLL